MHIVVKGWEIYRVNKFGRVFSNARCSIVDRKLRSCVKRKLKLNGGGHLLLTYWRKDVLVHRLTAAAFLGLDISNKLQVINHLDGNKLNNHISNLEIGTQKSNMEHAAKTGLTATGSKLPHFKLTSEVISNVLKLRNEGKTYRSISNETLLSIATISKVIRKYS